MIIPLLRELFQQRPLVQALTERSLALRYRGSALGLLWSFLNPLCLMLIYTLVFRYYIRFSQVEHYSIFLFCGLLPWIWFSSGLIEGAQAIVSSGHLITKSMFPAQVLPAVAVLSTGINFILSTPLLLIFMLIAGVSVPLTWILVPFVIALQALLMFGLVLGLASLNVRYRDVQHLLANLISFIFFLCPVVYPASSIPERFRFTLALNPFGVLVSIYHHLLYEGSIPSGFECVTLLAWTMAALVWGTTCYENNRERFAEWL